ncbi:MAG: TonB-dependent receptor [Cyanobacteria bacterium SW_9_44_58]|nr:MAG: TonB-dependent receptor [Cyanobacteria bacterium SW_9_44_58]
MSAMNKHLFWYAFVPITPLLVSNAVHAAPNAVTDVQLKSTANESLQLLLITDASEEIQTFPTPVGDNTLLIEIPNTQLQLPERESIRWSQPSTEIQEITVVQQSPESIQVKIQGATSLPEINVRSVSNGIALNLPQQGSLANTAPEAPETAPSPQAGTDSEPIELVVTATRTEKQARDVPRSTTVITREEIEEQSQLSDNLPDILGRTVPGLGPPTQSASNRTQKLRGRDPSVLIDGVPIDSNLKVFQDLRSISPNAVERIEVVRGPTAIYGAEAGGGVINIITRKPQETFTANTTFSIGPALSLSEFSQSFGAGVEQFFSGKVGDFDYVVAASYEESGNRFDAEGDLIPVGRSQGLDNLETFNILAKAGLDVTSDQRLELTVNYFDDKQDPPTLADPSVDELEERVKAQPLDLDGELDVDQLPGREDLTINLSYSHDDLLGSQLDAQVFFKDSTTLTIPQDNRNTIFQSVSRTITESEKVGARLDIETPLASNLDLLWGADYSDESIEQPLTIFDPTVFDNSGGTKFEQTDEAFFSPPYDLQSIGLFSQLSWQANDKLSLRGGLRFERFKMSVNDFNVLGEEIAFGRVPPEAEEVRGGDVSFDDVVFNIGAVYNVNDEVNIFANFSQGFSAPDFRRFLRFLPQFANRLPVQVSEDIQVTQPIVVDNYEIGLRGNWDNVQFSLAGFFTYSEFGQTERQSEDGSFLTSSREPKRTYGIEATTDYQINDQWQLGGNFTWVEGESSPEDVDDFVALSTTDIQPIKVGLYVENQTTPDWSNRLQLLIVGSRDRAFEDTIGGNTIDPFPIDGYTTLDWISRLDLGNGKLTFAVQNVFDNQFFPVDSQTQRRNREFAAGLGRTISLQYQLNW